ncbi:ADP-heptose:LPS heptosyltransferase [Roseiarcus fermentans]|uniref:ADP-heptose:LPS heptosyltransferase n=1 Tax=Roseiarcus fermentans TaxID=1473586 RepID=A0A366F3Y5_9HYPH|nr:glycosyltransferase family 9 protein [Roseiarcus fermentans]RBP08690.1 ADP-heptose:LPS heptosyltransferase [Roseiarcus fermentans]
MTTKEAQRSSVGPHFHVREGIGRLNATELPTHRLSEFVGQLLDEFGASEFRGAERIVDALERQGKTISGYPRIRPADCDRFLGAMRLVFDSYHRSFVTADPWIVRRFEEVLENFQKTDVRSYPRELMRARTLQAEALLLLNNPRQALELVSPYADRIYKIEGDRDDILRIMRLDCEARAALGRIKGLGEIAIARARAVTRLWPFGVRSIAASLCDFISFYRAPVGDGALAWILAASARLAVRSRVPGGPLLRRAGRIPALATSQAIASVCLFLLLWGDLRWTQRPHGVDRKAAKKDIVVTRAMGGIGDLLMMTAGLRALSRKRSTRIKLVIERKFFDLFRNNPYVELVDIDGPPLDVAECKVWRNLTLCPAAKYESKRTPFVKKGRVQLFAGGMGVGKSLLNAHGWHVEYDLDEAQKTFREDFLRAAGLGSRPIVGVQPYARDSYKDHQEIAHFIAALSKRYDLIIFHHLETRFGEGPGIVSTAGLSLANSLSLVSAIEAMVCVDSAFLHAASAFDVPVVALFGPTDGKLFTRHHRKATVITANDRFACAPCWRNEDLRCSLTGKFGPSPCIAAIDVQPVLDAVEKALRQDR